MLDLLSVDYQFAEPFRGINNLEILFNPDFPFRRAIPENRWRDIALNQLVFLIREENYLARKNEKWLVNLIDKLKQYPDFGKLWEQAKQNFREGIVPGENLIFFEDGKGKEICFFMSVTRVNSCPRFRITEYIPQ